MAHEPIVLENATNPNVEAYWQTGAEGSFQGIDDVTIRYRTFVKTDQKAAIVMSSGRTECMLKYQETIYDLSQAGYSVYILDHRGQGFSGRMTSDSQIGHVEDFDHYVHDLKSFVDSVVKPSQEQAVQQGGPNRLFLLAHSMGGCIASLYIEKHKHDFAAAALCSPMHQPATGLIPEKLADVIVDIKNWIGKKAHYAMGKGPYQDIPFDEVEDKKGAALTHSKERYEIVRQLYNKNPEVRIGGASNNWVNEAINAAESAREHADQIEIPVLLLQAGEDVIVTAEGQNTFATTAGSRCRLERIKGAYHELFVESDAYRKPALDTLLQFFKSQIQ